MAEGASPRWGEPGTIAHGIGVLLGRQVVLADAQFAEDRPDIAEGGDQVLQHERARRISSTTAASATLVSCSGLEPLTASAADGMTSR